MKIIETVSGENTITQHVVIEHEDGSTTTMFKSLWDELQAQQAEHLNGSVDGEAL